MISAAVMVARVFCVVLPGCSLDAAQARLQAMRQMAKALNLRYGGQPLPPVTLSGALAIAREESPEQLIARADTALYASKAAGRDRVTVAEGDPEHPDRAPALRLVGEAARR
jgi:GGDEF domain-containing protein